MKGMTTMILAILGLGSGCSGSEILTPAQFTAEFAVALRDASPNLSVDIVRDLELSVVAPNGHKQTNFLDNAYSEYKQTPEDKQAIIQRFAASTAESALSKQVQ